MKILQVLKSICFLFLCAISLPASAQSHFDITRTFFSTAPELREWYYRNISYTISFEYYMFIPDQHHANGYS
ncbi:MAG: hypothetical protein NTW14_01475 [bacterium]|nr:hypothetical protein [bacterium]